MLLVFQEKQVCCDLITVAFFLICESSFAIKGELDDEEKNEKPNQILAASINLESHLDI